MTPVSPRRTRFVTFIRSALICVAAACGLALLYRANARIPLSFYYLDSVRWDEKVGSRKELEELFASGWRPENQRIILAPGMDVRTLHMFGETDLKGIDFRQARLDAENLRELGRFRSLEWILFRECTFPDHSLDQLPELPRLVGFEVNSEDFHDDDVATVAAKYGKSLQYFGVSDSPVSDRGVETIATMKKLRVLSLSGTKITSRAIPLLCRMRHLEGLDVALPSEQLSGVEALCQIKHALPWIDIRLSDDQCDEVIRFNEANWQQKNSECGATSK